MTNPFKSEDALIAFIVAAVLSTFAVIAVVGLTADYHRSEDQQASYRACLAAKPKDVRDCK